MDIPVSMTERLILRGFTERDIAALYQIHSDKEVNRFLPWYPLATIEDAKIFYEQRYGLMHGQRCSYAYAICFKEDDRPIGYVDVGAKDSYDLGYGLHKAFWHKGIATEACRAVIEQSRKDGIPYITATHDIDNPRSGEVMKRLGMTYRYSYEERWLPKDILVTFRMYQLDLDGNVDRVYRRYWDESTVHFVETNV